MLKMVHEYLQGCEHSYLMFSLKYPLLHPLYKVCLPSSLYWYFYQEHLLGGDTDYWVLFYGQLYASCGIICCHNLLGCWVSIHHPHLRHPLVLPEGPLQVFSFASSTSLLNSLFLLVLLFRLSWYWLRSSFSILRKSVCLLQSLGTSLMINPASSIIISVTRVIS